MSLTISQAQSKYALNKCGHLENEVQNGNVYCLKKSTQYTLAKYRCSVNVSVPFLWNG